jgi:hypothetical protein
MHESFLVLRNFRYLKAMAILVAASIIAYVWHQPFDHPNGGTWLGYTLGGVGIALIVWLAWFGVRKRRYGAGDLTLQNWLSAHVYLGSGLIIVATLHTGFQFGWNVHMLAYVLMMLVIASGLFGVYAYIRVPIKMTQNRDGQTQESMLNTIAELDDECSVNAIKLSDDINEIIRRAVEETRIGGGFFRQLSGNDPNCSTALALREMPGQVANLHGSEAETGRRLVSLLARKSELLVRARRDVRLKAWIDIWLFVHIPLTFALLAALIVHVVSVFFYW